MVDTTSYTMPTKGGTYQIGLTIKDGDGNKLTASEVKNLVDKDFKGTRFPDWFHCGLGSASKRKLPGQCQESWLHIYILFEINDCHTSLRVDVKDNAKAGGAATRDTIYWSFANNFNEPLHPKAQSHYYCKGNNIWDQDAIVKEMIALGEQYGMIYDPSITIQNSSYHVPEDMDSVQPSTDEDAFLMQYNCFESIKAIGKNLSDRNPRGAKFRPYFTTEDPRYPGELLLYVPYR